MNFFSTQVCADDRALCWSCSWLGMKRETCLERDCLLFLYCELPICLWPICVSGGRNTSDICQTLVSSNQNYLHGSKHPEIREKYMLFDAILVNWPFNHSYLFYMHHNLYIAVIVNMSTSTKPNMTDITLMQTFWSIFTHTVFFLTNHMTSIDLVFWPCKLFPISCFTQ